MASSPVGTNIAVDCQSGSGSTGTDVIAIESVTGGRVRAVTSDYFGGRTS